MSLRKKYSQRETPPLVRNKSYSEMTLKKACRIYRRDRPQQSLHQNQSNESCQSNSDKNGCNIKRTISNCERVTRNYRKYEKLKKFNTISEHRKEIDIGIYDSLIKKRNIEFLIPIRQNSQQKNKQSIEDHKKIGQYEKIRCHQA